jgi:hypothetical protein
MAAEAKQPEPSPANAPAPVESKGKASVPKPLALPNDCNVVDCSTGKQQFWRFTKGKNQMKLVHVRETEADEPIQAKHLERDASQMWQPHCQNDAWLPSEQVFFRVLQLPNCDPRELPAMVEMQLERISPIPLGSAVWTFEVVPVFRTDRAQQTVVVMFAERAVVEQYVGGLEKIGYRPDRLETPVLHQVMATPQGGERPDGAWIYPRFAEEQVICTVAWWDEGVLHNITQICLTTRDHLEEFTEQDIIKKHLNELTEHLTATTWAGEMEGWLTSKTDWHLVVENDVGEQWLPILNEWAGQGVQVSEPPDVGELAAVSAARALRPLDRGNLLPPDIRARYHRDDVDRVLGNLFVWGLMIYIVCMAGYIFYWKPQVNGDLTEARAANVKMKKMKKDLKSLEVRHRLLRDQLELRSTALNVLKAVAEYMPEEVKLVSLTFNEKSGQRNNIILRGQMKQEAREQLRRYAEQLTQATVKDQETNEEKQLFSLVNPPNTDSAAGGYVNWNIVCLLRREEAGQ